MLRWHLKAWAMWAVAGVRSMEVEQEISCEKDGSFNADLCTGSKEDRGLLQTQAFRDSIMETKILAGDTTNLFKPLNRGQFEKYINPGGVDFRDIEQGLLGDCFLLAALGAIAMRRPDAIIKMFTDAELLEGKNPVYTVAFMMNGKKTKVAVNDMVPAEKSGAPYFAKGKRGAKWPIILEKAYAKAFGDYQRINGGFGGDVFKAVLNAPVTGIINNRMSVQDLFDKIKQSVDNKFILGAGTQPGCGGIGIYCGHAYTILTAGKKSEQFPQAVKMYNPHGRNRYSGKITGQDQSKGAFWVTAEEFHRHWTNVDIAEVREGAVVSPITLSTETQGLVALEFDMSSNDVFSVQLEWPLWRFWKRESGGGCEVHPQFTVLVAKKESLTEYKKLRKGVYYANDISNARVTLSGGSGKYLIYVSVKFPVAKSWLKEFVVNVYGPPTTLQVSKTAPADLLQAMGYQNSGYLQKSAKTEDEVDVDDDENLEGSCGHALDRLKKLNNGPEIARLGTDPMFPETWKSLVERKGLKCGDSATGAPGVGCEKYDSWQSFKFADACPTFNRGTQKSYCTCIKPGMTKIDWKSGGKTYYSCTKPVECPTVPSGTGRKFCTCNKPGMGRAEWAQGGKTYYSCGFDKDCRKYGMSCPAGSGGSQPTPAPTPQPRAAPAPTPQPQAATQAPQPEPQQPTTTTPAPAGNGEIVLGSSTKDEKCVTLPDPLVTCEFTVAPTGSWVSVSQFNDQYCVNIPGGWTEEVKLKCKKETMPSFW